MGLSVEAIIAIMALFVALIQPLCALWKYISRQNSKRETLPKYTIQTTSPRIPQDPRWPHDRHDNPPGLYKARKWEWEYYT
ncbi:unnamed protein product [Penicillium camemberti]|uniref:Str. FM013 n=1 Tax=Penicillium camemberti (strain FM 013) TaxID=1429867 RepID=A0A0G4PSI7_PENC3|nr:unnamed protein product [Penicillium camemberti]